MDMTDWIDYLIDGLDEFFNGLNCHPLDVGLKGGEYMLNEVCDNGGVILWLFDDLLKMMNKEVLKDLVVGVMAWLKDFLMVYGYDEGQDGGRIRI